MLMHEKQIKDYEKTLADLKQQNSENPLWSDDEIKKLELKLHHLKKKIYSELTPWQRIAICRHPARPKAVQFIQALAEDFVELSGDRLFRDDHAMIAGFGKISGIKCMIIGQEKGSNTEGRLYRNFGMPHPEGYRKALRCMQLAAKFRLPILTLIDTPGAWAGLSAEERGQGWAIAKNLLEMSRLPVPIVVMIIGEGCSGGALGIGIGDRIAMLQHSYYSVITPEGCASILWKDSQKKETAANALKFLPEDLLQFSIIDTIIPEPIGGAHHDPSMVYQNVKEYIVQQWNVLKEIPMEMLVEMRYQKFRKMGKFEMTDSTFQLIEDKNVQV